MIPPGRRGKFSFLALAGGLAGALAITGTSCIVQHGGGAGGTAGGGNLVPAADVKPVRQQAEAVHRRVGTALMSGQLDSEKVRKLVALHFDSLMPENEMKWEAVEPQPRGFSFAAGDKLVAFANENGMRMRGHTLVWHSQLA